MDDDENSTLDPAEIDDTKYICNGTEGTDGLNAVINTTMELSGDNCVAGGIRVDAGSDDDNVLCHYWHVNFTPLQK